MCISSEFPYVKLCVYVVSFHTLSCVCVCSEFLYVKQSACLEFPPAKQCACSEFHNMYFRERMFICKYRFEDLEFFSCDFLLLKQNMFNLGQSCII